MEEDIKWKRNSNNIIKKDQELPLVKLLWFNNNDTNNQPTKHQEYAHVLVPVNITQTGTRITQVIANFPPIVFMKGKHRLSIQYIPRMQNKHFYIAMRAGKTQPIKKTYRWNEVEGFCRLNVNAG